MAKKWVKGFGKRIFYTVLFLMLLSAGAYYIREKFFKPGFVHYKEFGIDIPTNYSIHGIDVSHHQNDINWLLVKKMKVKNVSLGFAFIKATEGANMVDDNFRDNMEDSKDAGMIRGAYHFFVGSKSGKAQAENYIDEVKLQKGDLPPVLDVEQSNGASVLDMQTRINDWLQMVEKRYKVKPIIYTNIDFYKTYLEGKFDEYPLWVAHYLVKDKPRINHKWAFWQHNESGLVAGIRGYVDFNVFSGDSMEFRKILLR